MTAEKEIIGDSLEVFDLSSKERSVFLFVLEFKDGVNVSLVGSEIEIPRQTANSILKKLVARGLVTKRKKKGVFMFSSNRKQIRKYAYATSRAIQGAAQNLIRILKLR